MSTRYDHFLDLEDVDPLVLRLATESALLHYQAEVADLTASFTAGALTAEDYQQAVHPLVDDINQALATALTEDPAILADARHRAGLQKEHFRTLTARPEDLPGRLATLCALPRNTLEESLRRLAAEHGMTHERRLLAEEGCCGECQQLASLSWQPLGTLPEIGDSVCLMDCTCQVEYGQLNLEGDEASLATFSLTSALVSVARAAVLRGLGLTNETINEKTPGMWYEYESRDYHGRWTSTGSNQPPSSTPGVGPAYEPTGFHRPNFDEDSIRSTGEFSKGMRQKDGSFHLGGNRALVHVDDQGRIDHGPKNLLGHKWEDIPLQPGHVKGPRLMGSLPYRGTPSQVAGAYTAERTFKANLDKELAHISNSMKLNGSSDAEIQQVQKAFQDAHAKEISTAPRDPGRVHGLIARAKELTQGVSAQEVLNNTGNGMADPRRRLGTEVAYRLPHLASHENWAGGPGGAGMPTHAGVRIKGVTTPSLDELSRGKLSDAADKAAADFQKVIVNKRATEEAVKAVHDQFAQLTDAEARTAAARINVATQGPVTATSVAGLVKARIDYLHGGAEQRQQRARDVEHTSTTIKGLRQGDTASAVKLVGEHLETAHRFQAFLPQHLNEAARGLQRNFTTAQLKDIHTQLHGDKPIEPTGTKGRPVKSDYIRGILHKHAEKLGAVVHLSEDDPLAVLDELVVTFDNRATTVDSLVARLIDNGLSDYAIDSILDECELAEDEDNDHLLSVVCMALAMRIQSLLFPVDQYSEKDIHQWCDDHDYAHDKIDTTANFHRVRQFDPEKCQGEPRTIAFKKAKGIKAVVCLMPAKGDDAEHSQEDDEPVRLVWYNGSVWDEQLVFLELLQAGFDDWRAQEILATFEEAKGKDEDEKTDEKGRTYVFRHLLGRNVMIYTDGGPQDGIKKALSFLADKHHQDIETKTTAAHRGALNNEDDKETRINKVVKAAIHSATKAHREHEQESQTAAKRGVVGRGLRKAKQLGGQAVEKAAQGARKAGRGAKTVGRAAATGAKKLEKGVQDVAQTRVGQAVVKASPLLQSIGQTHEQAKQEIKEKWNETREERLKRLTELVEKGPLLGKIKARLSLFADSVLQKIKTRILGEKGVAPAAGIITELKKPGLLGALKNAYRVGAAGFKYYSDIQHKTGEKAISQLKEHYGLKGAIAARIARTGNTVFHLATALSALGLTGSGLLHAINGGTVGEVLSRVGAGAAVSAGMAIWGKGATLWLAAGMAEGVLHLDRATAKIEKPLNDAIALAGQKTGAAVARVGARIPEGSVKRIGRAAASSVRALGEGFKPAAQAVGRLVGRKRASMAAHLLETGLPIASFLTLFLDDEDFNDLATFLDDLTEKEEALWLDTLEDAEQADFADVPPNFDWEGAWKTVAECVAEGLEKYFNWVHDNKEKFQPLWDILNKLDLDPAPLKDIAKHIPGVRDMVDHQPTADHADPEEFPLALQRAEFLQTLLPSVPLEVQRAARAEVDVFASSLRQGHGGRATRWALAGAILTPAQTHNPLQAAPLLAAAEALVTFKDEPMDGDVVLLRQDEALEAGAYCLLDTLDDWVVL